MAIGGMVAPPIHLPNLLSLPWVSLCLPFLFEFPPRYQVITISYFDAWEIVKGWGQETEKKENQILGCSSNAQHKTLCRRNSPRPLKYHQPPTVQWPHLSTHLRTSFFHFVLLIPSSRTVSIFKLVLAYRWLAQLQALRKKSYSLNSDLLVPPPDCCFIPNLSLCFKPSSIGFSEVF